MQNEFVPYDIALAMKELHFREECFGFYDDILNNNETEHRLFPIRTQTLTDKMLETLTPAPLYQQALNFLYSASNGKINISINGEETNEERDKKFRQAIEDLRNLQNNKP